MTDAVRFEGTDRYIAGDDLISVVNAAAAIGRPLLVKGEPGTGKTVLADAVSEALGLPLIAWHIKSSTKAVDGLYTYDVVQRLNDSRFGDGDISDISRYISLGPLGRSFAADQRNIVLIDEIDKADLEFPNDLLRELDEMAFTIPETGETIRAAHRPFVLITSNAEKELPDAFLRRCVFHWLAFPDPKTMARIVKVHLPDLPTLLLQHALDSFFELRSIQGLRKPPGTSEFLDWLAVLVHAGLSPDDIDRAHPFLGVLLKNERDLAVARRKLG